MHPSGSNHSPIYTSTSKPSSVSRSCTDSTSIDAKVDSDEVNLEATLHVQNTCTCKTFKLTRAKSLQSKVDVNSNSTIEVLDKPILSTPYKEVSILHSSQELLAIIVGNCICSGVVCAFLWGVSKRPCLSQWEVRVFNTLSLLLSAMLAFGIGFLCDKVGLLGRGALLQSRAHPVKHIGYIIKGSLSSYLSILIRTPTNPVIALYVLFSLCGRFSVAFLGFGYNMDQTVEDIPPLLRPDWVNLTVSRGAFKSSSTTSSTTSSDEPEISSSYQSDPCHNNLWGSLDVMCQLAQISRGLALPEDGDLYIRPEEWGNLESFADLQNLHMEIMNITLPLQLGNSTKVLYRYQFQDFRGRGGAQMFSGWEAVIQTSCIRYEIPLSYLYTNSTKFVPAQRDFLGFLVYPFLWSNFHNEPPIGFCRWRWIIPTVHNDINETKYILGEEFSSFAEPLVDSWSLEAIPRDEGFRVWLLGLYTPEFTSDFSTRFLFNCTVSIEDVTTSSAVSPTTDFLEWGTKRRILGQRIYEFLRISFVEGGRSYDAELDPLTNGVLSPVSEIYKDIYSDEIFTWGVSQDRHITSETWLAAYIGRYLVNQLSFLNDFLAPIEIELGYTENRRKLIVTWSKIVNILGGLACFQVLFAMSALGYCRGKFELLDDVSTISSVLDGFSDTVEPKGTDCGGEFVREGNGFRWVLIEKKHD